MSDTPMKNAVSAGDGLLIYNPKVSISMEFTERKASHEIINKCWRVKRKKTETKRYRQMNHNISHVN